MKTYIIILVYTFFIFIAKSGYVNEIDYFSAENIYKFAEDLYQSKDFLRSANEYERYLKISSDKTDFVLYKLGLCYRKSNDINKAVEAFQRLEKDYPSSIFKFSSSYQIAYSYLISEQYLRSNQYINFALKNIQNEDESIKLNILMAFGYMKQRQWASAKNALDKFSLSNDEYINKLLIELKDKSMQGMNTKRKSRFLASVLSMLVPGTGKIYCKQYGNGIYSFATVTSTGLLSWYGFRENGIRSIKGWIFGSLFTIFYTGNVYGSGISALTYNRQLDDELLMSLPLLPDEW